MVAKKRAVVIFAAWNALSSPPCSSARAEAAAARASCQPP